MAVGAAGDGDATGVVGGDVDVGLGRGRWSARAGAILAGAAPLAAAFLLGEIFVAAMGAMFAVITAGVDRWSAPRGP